jgi:L-2,4-diaminobutyrate decarboxylase
MMGVSSLATAVLFRDKDTSYDNFAQDASYIMDETKQYEWFNSAKRTIECTKNMMAAKVYSILKLLGPQFFIDYLESCYDNGKLFAERINDHPDFQLAFDPQTNIVCFRYFNSDLTDTDLNILNQKAWTDSLQDGKFYIVQTQINNNTYFRTSLMNPFTTEKEMTGLLDYLIEKINSYE